MEKVTKERFYEHKIVYVCSKKDFSNKQTFVCTSAKKNSTEMWVEFHSSSAIQRSADLTEIGIDLRETKDVYKQVIYSFIYVFICLLVHFLT